MASGRPHCYSAIDPVLLDDYGVLALRMLTMNSVAQHISSNIEHTGERLTVNSPCVDASLQERPRNTTTLRDVSGRSFNSKNQNSAFTFDGNGNPTTYQSGASLTYDPEDRMTGYGTALTAGYTGEALRAWKNAGSGRTYFLYAGGIPVCEMDASGNVTAVNTFGPTGLLARHAGSSSAFYTFDPQGNVVQTLDSTGGVTATALYDAYGTKLNAGSLAPFGYGAQSGYYTDPETGLLLLTHRYYDPEEARFLTRDPIGYSGGMNLYGYVGGNPVNMVDPLGFCKFTPAEFDMIEEILDFEAKYGTKAAAAKYSNTAGYFLGWVPGYENAPMSDVLGEDHPVPTTAGIVDLDWWTDLILTDPTNVDAIPYIPDLTYTLAKLLEKGSGPLENPPKDVRWPYQDRKERAAVAAIRSGKRHYRELFPPEFMQAHRPENRE